MAHGYSDGCGLTTGLSAFLSPVRAWFEETFGQPTPPQAQGWPAIQRGEHTLILAPTGSGKTLAAFLWGIDQLFRKLAEGEDSAPPEREGGVWLVYISPLKALNNDIQRNLRVPLTGIRLKAHEMSLEFPTIRVAVRSGDTPQRERQAMLREPPHILITTPESLYLLLTSPKAREMFRTVRTVIVDEIHTLAGNKRGVHLTLSLERLQHLAEGPVQRIGLSATIRPLDEVARFLGGNEWYGSGDGRTLQPRPVTVVDAAYKKALDLQVVTVIDDFRNLPGNSVWPSIIPSVLNLIRQHRTTLVFTNNRRLAERTGDYLNEQIAAEAAGRASGLIKDGVVTGVGLMATGDGTRSGPIRVHHGSVAKEARLELERQLKAGELPALVGTSSLELGIDIGTVDLIVQLQSPKSVAQGLQRVGRSGHLVGQTSKGRIFPTHREDVIEAAAIAGGMLRGEVELTHTPRQPLDVLAQQIVAMVSVEPWDVDALYDLVRCAYAYAEVTPRVFQSTLEMLAGRYPSRAYRELRARLDWDRVNRRLAALPGSRLLASTNGGTIPDTGAFGAYLSDGKTKLGELDEEFIYETKIGDTLMLGSQVWRVVDISDDRITVTEAPGAIPRMPFWRGDLPWRPYELGRRVGVFRRLLTEKLGEIREVLRLESYRDLREYRESPVLQQLLVWLEETYALDALSAWHTLDYVAGQLDQTGTVASDRVILVEAFTDALGDPRMVVHSPFGGRVNGPWGLALVSALRERTGTEIELETNDDGILVRFLDAEAELPLDIVAEMGPAEARERILRELPSSAVFGARFRQNAARALLLPGLGHGKRTPFWLQRLRARDLLQVVRGFDDFPIVAETYRDCLQDVMDLPHLEKVLGAIQRGEIRVVATESATPSPVAQGLLFNFISVRMYEWDTPRAEQQLQMLALNRDLLQDLLKDVALDELLRPEAIETVRGQLQHTLPTAWARTPEELAVVLQRIGDLTPSEIAQRTSVDPAGWIARLTGEGRVIGMMLPTTRGPDYRLVAAEYGQEYATAFALPDPGVRVGDEVLVPEEACRRILSRYLGQAGPTTLEEVRARYAFPEGWLVEELDRLIQAREVVHGHFTPKTSIPGLLEAAADEYVDRRALEQIHRRTLHILRKEVQPVPFTVYADFLAGWQHVYPEARLTGEAALPKLLQQLRAAPVTGRIWERDVFPLRMVDYDPEELAALCRNGEVVWVGAGGSDPRRGRVRFLFRGDGSAFLEAPSGALPGLSEPAQSAYGFLKSEGAVFFAELCEGVGQKESAVEAALVELVMAGLVTNDSLEAMRKLVSEGAPQTQEPKLLSSLEEELSLRRQALGLHSAPSMRRPSRSRYESAKHRVRQRLEQPATSTWMGRWALVHRFGVLGKPLSPMELAARQARQLLARYGVITHTSLDDEIGSWDWRLIYSHLQQMEMRGEVRRGYFIQGLEGVQFALPEVVETLRRLRDEAQPEATPVVLNACDPANLYGPARDGLGLSTDGAVKGVPLSFARVPTTWMVQARGLPVLVATNGGTALSFAPGVDDAVLHRSLVALLDHLIHFGPRVLVETLDDEPVLESSRLDLLESVGFYRYYPAMAWERGR